MGDPKGFIKTQRKEADYRPVCERITDYKQVTVIHDEAESRQQASRCMDCCTPFCHWGCPIGNYIPEWNDYAFSGNWEKAYELISATNNFPEITGRLCPAVCEYACVLGINDDPVTIRENELAVIEYAFKNRLVKPNVPQERTGKRIAVVGSGPAGLACASQLNRAGHSVTVYEKNKRPGGILRYGIPDFKLEKYIIDRRQSVMEEEGIVFKNSVNIGTDYPFNKLLKENDAVCLAIGSSAPRDLNIHGREFEGIHFAMDYLVQQNRIVAGEKVSKKMLINAKGKKVVVIGGGDTGADCVGTANRQGAACVVQIELLQKPKECRTDSYPWPLFPMLLKTSSSHEEGVKREWSIQTKRFIGENNIVKKLECVRLELGDAGEGRCPAMKEISGSSFEIEADLVILAAGFLHPEKKGLLDELGVKLDKRGNVETDSKFMTSRQNVFAAGDMHRGQSLIAWAIAEGREAAYNIDKYLMGKTELKFM